MRIISKFHDYYDGLANVGGHDNTIVYERNTEMKDSQELPVFITWPHETISLLVFCGEAHMFCERQITHDSKMFGSETEIKRTWNSPKEIADKLNGRKTPFFDYTSASYLQNFLETIRRYDWTPVHLEHKSPILLIKKQSWRQLYSITLNPRLTSIQFPSVMDPYTAFQKLEGFVDTHFTRTVNMVELSEADRIAKHGFDKYSFRKDPTKKV